MAAKPLNSMAHPQQSDSVRFLKIMLLRNSDAIIPDCQFQHPRPQTQRHLHMQRAGMPVDVQ